MPFPATRAALERAGYKFDCVGRCRGHRCGGELHWWYSPRGVRIPLNPDCTSHHTTCPDAAQFKRPRR